MEEKQEEKKDVKRKKHTVRNTIIILVILVIVLLCGTYALHTQKLLPDGLEEILSPMLEPVDKLFGNENKENDNKKDEKNEKESEKEENEIYEVIAELDEKYEDEEVEIIDIYNADTEMFATYSEDVRNTVSILIVGDKKGLISNEDGEILVKPEYDYMFSELVNTDSEEYIIGSKGRTNYQINLRTFDIEKVEELPAHGGGSDTYYDPETEDIYTAEYEPTKYEPLQATIDKIKESTGGKLDICYEFGYDEEYKEGQELKAGYYDVTNGKIVIKPEFNKASLFDNGVAAVKKGRKAYFINKNNKKVYDIEFEDVANIHEGRAWIKEEGKWKLIKFNKDEDEEENDIAWKEIYKEYILDENLEEFDETNSVKEASISFIDLDSDGVPELLYYDGMAPGPRGNLMYSVYKIEDDEVKEMDNVVWAGPFVQMGYNSKKDTYAFVTKSAGISATEAGITLADSNGLEDKLYTVEEEEVYSLEDNGYETKEINIEETTLLASYSEKEKEKAIEEAIENYLPNEELYNK